MIRYILILTLGMASCTPLKWKYDYVGKRLYSFEKYTKDTTGRGNLHIELDVPTGVIPKKKIKHLTKRKIIQMMDRMERGAALVPDSLYVDGNRIDSFYHDIDKIKFIKEKKLLSPHIYFMNQYRK